MGEKKSTTIHEPLVSNMHLLVLRKITLKRASMTLKGKQLITETESLKSQDPDRKIQPAFTGYINQNFLQIYRVGRERESEEEAPLT